MLYLRFLILALIFPAILFSQDNQQLFKTANDAYLAKNFQLAIEQYEAILESGSRSPVLYYNLGNAYYSANKLGKAILNYERGLLLDPSDEDLNHNIELVRKKLRDQIEALSPFFLSQWWHKVRQLVSSKSWAIIALLLFFLGIGGLILWLFSNSRKQKKIGFFAGILLLIFSVIPFAFSINSAGLEENSGRAIITAKEVDLRSGPDEVSTSILRLHEGTSLHLLDRIGDWYKIRLVDGEQGWLLVSSFEKI